MSNTKRDVEPVVILHVINSFRAGGAETLLRTVATKYQDERSTLVICYLMGHGEVLAGYSIPYPVFDLSWKGRFTPFALLRLWIIMLRYRVRIVHTHDAQSGILARMAAGLTGGKTIVSTRHNAHLVGPHRFIYAIENMFLRFQRKVIAISQSVANTLHNDYAIPKNKIVVIPNSIDVDSFAEEVSGSTREGAPLTIGCVARLTRQKGIDILIAAFALFLQRFPDSRLMIVGEGELRETLEAQVRRMGLERNVLFRGMLLNRALREAVSVMDIFVLSSRWEGFGISLIEAMAMKRPVIASKVDGIVEIVEHGSNGLLVEPESPEALNAALLRLADEPALRRLLGDAARRTVQERYSIRNYCTSLAAEYRRLSE